MLFHRLAVMRSEEHLQSESTLGSVERGYGPGVGQKDVKMEHQTLKEMEVNLK